MRNTAPFVLIVKVSDPEEAGTGEEPLKKVKKGWVWKLGDQNLSPSVTITLNKWPDPSDFSFYTISLSIHPTSFGKRE